jgi:hypothetical protein
MTTTFRKLNALAFASDVGGTLRNIQGYAFETPPTAGSLRSISGYAFQSVKPALNLSVTGDKALYALINNNSLYTSWSASTSTLGTPVADSSVANTNTRVNLAAKSSSGYGGNINLHYNRRPISDAINTSVSLGTIASDTTVWALLPTINSKYGTNLTTQDVVNATVKAGSTVFPLVADTGSWLFLPGSLASAGTTTDLATATPATALSGFDNAAGVGPRGQTLALFHFDGSTGSPSLLDASGKNVASTVGSVATSTSSKFGSQAVSMASSGAAIVLPDQPYLRFTGQDATLEGWFGPSNTTQNGVLFSKEASSPTVYTELQYYQGSIRLWLDSASLSATAASSMTANVYTHVALVSYKGVWYVYENGVLKFQVTGGNFGNNNAPFRIGNWGGLNAPFTGLIDEVRISNFARYTGPFTPPTGPFVAD